MKNSPGRRVAAAALSALSANPTLIHAQTLPTVYVVSSPFSSSSTISPAYITGAGSNSTNYGGGSVVNAIVVSAGVARAAATVRNPLVHRDFQDTTADSPLDRRWLAAQDVFNVLVNQNLLMHYLRATQLTFMYEGVKYRGFAVTYADGSRETWAIMPNYATSSIKLFWQPLPGSLTR